MADVFDIRAEALLDALFDQGASELVVSAHAPPSLRIDGQLVAFGSRPLSPEETRRLVEQFLNTEQRARLQSGSVGFSFQWTDRGRVRGCAYHQRGTLAVTLRGIPGHIPGFAELHVPEAVERLAELREGLVVFSGGAGMGASTTQAAILDWINRSRACHVMTIEDPIEHVHFHRRSIIDQQEVGVDTPSFAEALRRIRVQRPDVLLVGEMPDLATITEVLAIADTGRLVLATVRADDCARAIEHIVDVFSTDQRQYVRTRLAHALRAVVAQRLVPGRAGGRVAAFEVLVATEATRRLVRDGDAGGLRRLMASAPANGSRTMEASLLELAAAGLIDGDQLGTSAPPARRPLQERPGGHAGLIEEALITV